MRDAIGEAGRALFGSGCLELPSADDLASLPSASLNPTVNDSKPKIPHDTRTDPNRPHPVVDLSSSSSGDLSDGPTKADRPPRANDSPTAQHVRPRLEPESASFDDAETVHRNVDVVQQTQMMFVEPKAPASVGVARSPSDPNLGRIVPPVERPRRDGWNDATGRRAPFGAADPFQEIVDGFKDVIDRVVELSRPVLARVRRAEPEALLVVIVGVAIVVSLILLVALATTRSHGTSSDAPSAPPAASVRPRR